MRRTTIAVLLLIVSTPLLATEPNPSNRQRELVTKLLVVMDADGSTRAVADALFGQIEKQFIESAEAKGNRPEDIEEAKERFALFREKAMRIDFDGLLEESMIRIYSKYFTESEIEQLIAFYQTPAGRKSITVMGDLSREAFEAGAREISPKIDEVMRDVEKEMDKKRPWRRTMSDLRRIATALEAYSLDNDELYPTGDYAALEALLAPDYLDEFPKNDIWGHAYAYVVSPDRKHYRLVSAGADSIFDWDSRRITGAQGEIRYRDRLEDDIIFADLGFVQLPVQAKAEMDH